MMTAQDYVHYITGYAEARLGPYPEPLRYNLVVALDLDDNAVMLRVSGTLTKHKIAEDDTVHRVQEMLGPIEISRHQFEDNMAPHILDQQLPAWREAAERFFAKPRVTYASIQMAGAISAVHDARKLAPHVGNHHPEGR